MIRSTSARTLERVKICRGASLISGGILSYLMPLVALQDDAVDDRIFADGDDQIAGFGAGDDDVGEQFGRVEVLQRLIERFGGICLAGGEIGVGRGPFRAQGARHRGQRSSGWFRTPREPRRHRWRGRDGRRRGRGTPVRPVAGAVLAPHSGADQPPRIVPTKSIAPARLPITFVPEITRPRLFTEWQPLHTVPAVCMSALPQPI